MDLGLRIRAADRRVDRSPHSSPCPYSGDERRKLSARDKQKRSARARSTDKYDRQNNSRGRRRRGTPIRRRQHGAMLRYATHASMLAAKENKTRARGPFLSTRPVHFHAAIWHIFSPPLTEDPRSYQVTRRLSGLQPCLTAAKFTPWSHDPSSANRFSIDAGIVTSPCDERAKSARRGYSNYCERLAPSAHRGGAERSVRSGRCEMALEVE